MNSLFGGDFQFLWPENIKEFAQFPSAWDSFLNTGIGAANVSFWLNSYVALTSSFSYFGLSWISIVLLFWILPVFLGSFIFTFLLFRSLFPELKRFGFLAGALYACNTYLLMIVFGGQMGIGLAYACVPLVLYAVIRVFTKPILLNALLAGLALGLQILFDPRFVYMTMFGVIGYFLLVSRKWNISFLVYSFVIPIATALLLHSFWLLPLLFGQRSSVVEHLGSTNEFSFFSFADFPHTLSLLHPNWPENIFGKTYFMHWEFLTLPFLAFSSLLFLDKKQTKQKQTILFFALMALCTAFLAKGTNEPFEQVNQFLFHSFPGMTLFRDPTKFYVLTALAYSMLIPYTLFKVTLFFKSKFKNQKYLPSIIVLFFIGFWIFSLRLLVTTDILKPHFVPHDYIQFTKYLVNGREFSRTLWIPQRQRYGFFSLQHPAVSSQEFFNTASPSAIVHELKQQKTQQLLQDASIKYVVVPYDSEGEIFVEDRKYDEMAYQTFLQNVRTISWLDNEKDFGKIAVFEITGAKNHFWIANPGTKISYTKISDTKYHIIVSNAKANTQLVFSEGFDSGWEAKDRIKDQELRSKEYNKMITSFILPKDGAYELEVYYKPQQWVERGLAISTISLVTIIGILLFLRKKL